MKKCFFHKKLFSALCALTLFGTGMFISCSDGDDSNKSQTVSVTGITVSPESTTLYVDPIGVDGGKSEISLTAKVSPDNATNKAVT